MDYQEFKGETVITEAVKAIKTSQPLMNAKMNVIRVDKSKMGCNALNCADETLHLSPRTVVYVANVVDDDSISSLDENQLPSVNATTNAHFIQSPCQLRYKM